MSDIKCDYCQQPMEAEPWDKNIIYHCNDCVYQSLYHEDGRQLTKAFCRRRHEMEEFYEYTLTFSTLFNTTRILMIDIRPTIAENEIIIPFHIPNITPENVEFKLDNLYRYIFKYPEVLDIANPDNIEELLLRVKNLKSFL